MKNHFLHGRGAGGVIFLLFFCSLLLAGKELEHPYDWGKAEKICDGVLLAFRKVSRPRVMQIHVLRIDLHRKEFRFLAAQRDKDWGKPMKEYPHYPIRVTRETPKQYLARLRKERSLDMIAAVNATGWAPWKREYGVFYKYACRMGLVISEGVLVEYAHNRPYPVFLITKKNEYQIRVWHKDKDDPAEVALAVTGNAITLKNGVVMSFRNQGKAPRTAYGLSRDKRYLYWMTVGGRMPFISEGATLSETGMILRSFGADTVLNMDGGGSTMLAVCPEGKERSVRKCNFSFYNRKVACSVGLYRVKQGKE